MASPEERLELARELLEGHASEVGKPTNSPRYEAKCQMAAFLLGLFEQQPPRQTKFEVNEVYMLDTTSLRTLENVMTRLYGDRPITPDQRRDLANAMDAALLYASRYDRNDRPGGEE